MLLKLEKFFQQFSNITGNIAAFVLVIMVFNVFYNAIMRYVFNTGSIALQEMQWHLFSIVFLFGISYTLKEDGHVRVDLIYDKLPCKKKAIINMVGVIVFILPISLLIIFGSIDFVKESYELHEISGNPGGLTHRWLIKAAIPLSFIFLIISSIGFFIKNLNLYKKEKNSYIDLKENKKEKEK